MRIPLIRPYLPEGTARDVVDVLASGFMVEGPVTARLEECAGRFLGAAHCLAVDSCTTGLEMAVRCLGIGPGDEVIIPDYTFPATGLAVLAAGAGLVIVDVNPRTMNIDEQALKAALTPATKAVMPVSTFGNPLPYEMLNGLKAENNFFIIEDAACAFGAEYKGSRVGTQADISVFSLHPRKFITAARGGLITSENDEWAGWMRAYKCFGKGNHTTRADTVFGQMGANAMLPDVLSAIALRQMDVVEEMLTRRRELAARYDEELVSLPGVEMPDVVDGGVHSRQSYCVFIEDRDRVMQAMRAEGIEVQIGTYALHRHPVFSDNREVRIEGEMTGSAWAFDHCLTLPLYHEMTEAEQGEVIASLASHLAAR